MHVNLIIIFVTSYANKNITIFLVFFSVTKLKQKSKGVLDFGHFKNVHFWKTEKSLEKYPFFHTFRP